MLITSTVQNRSVKRGMASKYFDNRNYNYCGLKRNLKSTEFGNLVIFSQRPVERNLRVQGDLFKIKQHPFRPVIGLYKKYSWVDLNQY